MDAAEKAGREHRLTDSISLSERAVLEASGPDGSHLRLLFSLICLADKLTHAIHLDPRYGDRAHLVLRQAIRLADSPPRGTFLAEGLESDAEVYNIERNRSEYIRRLQQAIQVRKETQIDPSKSLQYDILSLAETYLALGDKTKAHVQCDEVVNIFEHVEGKKKNFDEFPMRGRALAIYERAGDHESADHVAAEMLKWHKQVVSSVKAYDARIALAICTLGIYSARHKRVQSAQDCIDELLQLPPDNNPELSQRQHCVDIIRAAMADVSKQEFVHN